MQIRFPRRLNCLRTLLTVVTALIAAPAPAQQSEVAAHWRGLTMIDLEAAYRILREDHPASVEAVGDAAFRERLESGYAAARTRAAQVNSSGGYIATLAAFAIGMGDKHIRSRPLVAPASVEWAGMVIGRRGSDWVVVAEDETAGTESLTGARLLSCDGMTADALAEQRLGTFRAVWSVDAQRMTAAPFLLVDDGNPFLVRPGRCLFDLQGQQREITLRWRRPGGNAGQLFARAVPRGQAGFGVRRSGDGYWIALQSLNDEARPVVAAVQTQADAMRRAPFIVLDLRGNSGGNSAYGDQIAEALVGADHARQARNDTGRACNTVWRASERNLQSLEQVQREIAERQGAEAAAYWADAYRDAVAARAAGRPFGGPITCGDDDSAQQTGSAPRVPSAYDGRLVVLTDHVCFSSCLLVTDRFRRLGALHVGQETDAATRYYEVREDRLPSGLSMFSTLQALSPGSPPQIGPFVPQRVYGGDISDTAALEAWVASLLTGSSGSN